MNSHIVNLRTHLQVALLAIGQLRRKSREPCEVERFAKCADDALTAMRHDLAMVSGEVAMQEDREASRLAHARLRRSLPRRTSRRAQPVPR